MKWKERERTIEKILSILINKIWIKHRHSADSPKSMINLIKVQFRMNLIYRKLILNPRLRTLAVLKKTRRSTQSKSSQCLATPLEVSPTWYQTQKLHIAITQWLRIMKSLRLIWRKEAIHWLIWATYKNLMMLKIPQLAPITITAIIWS